MSSDSSPMISARASMAIMQSPTVLSSSLDSIGAAMSQWVPDSERKQCGDCCEPFSPFIRKHHCRSCGEIFCSNCSRRFLLLPKYKLNGYSQPQRTCSTCVELHGPATLQSIGTVEHRLPVWDLPLVVTKKLPFCMNGELMEAGEYVFRVCSSSKVTAGFRLSQAVESDDNLAEWEKRIAKNNSSLDMTVQMNAKDLCQERYFHIATPSTWSLSVAFSSAFSSANVTVSILKSCTCEMATHFNAGNTVRNGRSRLHSVESFPRISPEHSRLRSKSSIAVKTDYEPMEVEMKEMGDRERYDGSNVTRQMIDTEMRRDGESATLGENTDDVTAIVDSVTAVVVDDVTAVVDDVNNENEKDEARESLEAAVRDGETYGKEEEEESKSLEEELEEWGFHTVDRDELLAEYGRERLRQELSVRYIPMKAVKKEAFTAACALWPPYEGHTALTYPQKRARAEMERWSIYREQAYELGLVRPFLLLVSMHPEVRLSYAQLLEVPLWEREEFGDCHAEAYAMLVQDPKSIVQRAKCAFKEEGDWYQLLWRIASQSLSSGDACEETRTELKSLSTSYAESLGYCKEPENPYVNSIEEVFLKGLVQVFDNVKESRGEEECDDVRLYMESDCLDALVAKLRAAGFADPWLMKRLATATFLGRSDHIASALEDWCEQKQFYQGARQVASVVVPGSILLVHLLIAASPLFTLSPLSIIPATSLAINVARLALFSKTPFSILLPVIGIVCQRELLAYHDMTVDSFYGVDDTKGNS